jgi:transcription elongation factor Elf1
MKTSDRPQIASTTMVVECPWCTEEASVETIPAGTRDASTFTCRTCSIDVALAPDPVGRLVATAA